MLLRDLWPISTNSVQYAFLFDKTAQQRAEWQIKLEGTQ